MVTISALVRDFFYFSILAIILAYFVNIIFPFPSISEPPLVSLLIGFIHLFAIYFILVIIYQSYITLFGQDPETNLGFSMFKIIFILFQIQVVYRFILVFCVVTGRKFVMEKSYY